MGKKKTHEEFENELYKINDKIEILGTYNGIHTKIKCRCKIDGYIWNAEPNHLLHGHGCPLCGGTRVIKGYNDVATLYPELLYLFKDKKEAETTSIGSNKKVTLVCPDCGNEKKISLTNYLKNGMGCQYCSDGVSYPEKFMRAFVEQCKPSVMKCQYQPDWAMRYFYDVYFKLNNIEYIIETDGGLHYEDNPFTGASIEEQKCIDDIKDQLALEYGIKVIRIDCRKSDKLYISTNIKNSELSNIIQIEHIDWDYCDKKAQSSLVKNVCDFYNSSDIRQTQHIANIFNLNRTTIEKYLHIGNNLGWCVFSTKPRKLGVRVLNKDMDVLYEFESIKKCADSLTKIYNIKFSASAISAVCKKKRRTHRGYVFEYI